MADAEPLRCENQSVDRLRVGTVADDYQVVVTAMAPNMQCRLRFFVANTSGSDVRVESIRLPVMGPRGGAGVRATSLDGIGTGAAGDVDAMWRVDRELGDGEWTEYSIQIEFRPDGCSSERSTLSMSPAVVVSSWGMDVTVEPAAHFVGFVGTAESSCDG